MRNATSVTQAIQWQQQLRTGSTNNQCTVQTGPMCRFHDIHECHWYRRSVQLGSSLLHFTSKLDHQQGTFGKYWAERDGLLLSASTK